MSPIDSNSTATGSASLTKTSRPWTDAESAAGYVLRYLVPMREQLIQWMGSETLADESLKRLIAHLVTQGFGDNRKGRIRDFLMRGIRSAAKSAVGDAPQDRRPAIDFATWAADSPSWLAIWRKSLLARAWRGLERIEHKTPSQPLYTALRAATEHPTEDASMLAVRINTSTDLNVEIDAIRQLLVKARLTFESLLTHEVAETLDDVSPEVVQQEIAALGMGGIFSGQK